MARCTVPSLSHCSWGLYQDSERVRLLPVDPRGRTSLPVMHLPCPSLFLPHFLFFLSPSLPGAHAPGAWKGVSQCTHLTYFSCIPERERKLEQECCRQGTCLCFTILLEFKSPIFTDAKAAAGKGWRKGERRIFAKYLYDGVVNSVFPWPDFFGFYYYYFLFLVLSPSAGGHDNLHCCTAGHPCFVN